ncbi:hypothetical protein RDABS01_027469, partial [Bienertia sinuspersici]
MSNTNNEIKSEDEVVAIEPNGGVGVWNESIETYLIGLIEDKHELKEKTNKGYSQDQPAKTFRKKGCKHYHKLCTIFGYTIITRASYHPFTKSPSDSKDGDDTDGEVAILEKVVERILKPRNPSLMLILKKLRDKVNIAMVDALIAMSENSKKKLELLEKKMSATTSKTINDGVNIGNYSKGNHDLLMDCIDALGILEEMTGILLQ